MNREEAWDLVRERIKNDATRAHMLASEACMRALARRLGEDEETWGLAGLVHDVDLEEVEGELERHGHAGARLLEARGAPPEVVHAVEVHPGHGERRSLLDKALYAVDPTTGFITSASLVVPSKRLDDLRVKSIKKRMKDRRFSAAVDRDQIRSCAELGLELDEFLGLCLEAMRRLEA